MESKRGLFSPLADMFNTVMDELAGKHPKDALKMVIPNINKYNIPKIAAVNAIPIKYIVIHHSFGPDGVTRDTGGIIYYHTHWADGTKFINITEEEARRLQYEHKPVIPPSLYVKYNYLVENINGVEQVVIGRPLSVVGGHAKGFNGKSASICAIGNFDAMPPDQITWNVTLELTRRLMKTFKVPREKVIGHRETFVLLEEPVEKSCPGTKWDMDKFRKEL